MKLNAEALNRKVFEKIIYRVIRRFPFRREWKRRYCLVHAWKLEHRRDFRTQYQKEFEALYKEAEGLHSYGFDRVFKDYWRCFLLFGAVPSDYFDIFGQSWRERSQYVTREKLYFLDCVLNPIEDIDNAVPEVNDKLLAYRRWSSELGRPWADPFDMDEAEFVRTFAGIPRVLIKPRDSYGGYGIRTQTVSCADDLAALYRTIREDGVPVLVEEYYCQKGLLHSFNPSTLNTMRVITICGAAQTQVVGAFLRCGSGDKLVDNFSQGGYVFPIDVSNGVLQTGYGFHNLSVAAHPLSGVQVAGATIPNWEGVKAFCIKAHRKAPEGVRLIGWDVCVSDGEILLIEANTGPGFGRIAGREDEQWKACGAMLSELEESGIKLDSKWL